MSDRYYIDESTGDQQIVDFDSNGLTIVDPGVLVGKVIVSLKYLPSSIDDSTLIFEVADPEEVNHDRKPYQHQLQLVSDSVPTG